MARTRALRASAIALAATGVAFTLAPVAGAGRAVVAAHIDPIVGTWHGAGGTIVITAGYPAFQGKVQSTVTFGSCTSPPGDLVWTIEPGGDFGEPAGSYRGEQVVGNGVYYGDPCYVDAVFSVSGNTLTVVTTETTDGNQSPAGTYTFTRVGASVPATKHWSWSFAIAALPSHVGGGVKHLAGTRASARGTIVTTGPPEPTDAGFELYKTKQSSHPAVTVTDLYLYVRNLRTLLHVKRADVIEGHEGALAVALEGVVRFADLPSCRAGSQAIIMLLPATSSNPAGVRIDFCHVHRVYENAVPDASDSVNVSIAGSA